MYNDNSDSIDSTALSFDNVSCRDVSKKSNCIVILTK